MRAMIKNRRVFDQNIEASNPRKTDDCLDLGAVELSDVLKPILAITGEEWDQHHKASPNYNQYGVLKHTRQMTFKFSNKMKQPFVYFDTPLWTEWKPRLYPIMESVTRYYGYSKVFYPRVMFAKLLAHSSIEAHTDGGISRSRPHKIHVPITTNPGCFFVHPPEAKYHLEVGRAYEVNNCRQHGAVNDGDTDRIHFIFECVPLE